MTIEITSNLICIIQGDKNFQRRLADLRTACQQSRDNPSNHELQKNVEFYRISLMVYAIPAFIEKDNPILVANPSPTSLLGQLFSREGIKLLLKYIKYNLRWISEGFSVDTEVEVKLSAKPSLKMKDFFERNIKPITNNQKSEFEISWTQLFNSVRAFQTMMDGFAGKTVAIKCASVAEAFLIILVNDLKYMRKFVRLIENSNAVFKFNEEKSKKKNLAERMLNFPYLIFFFQKSARVHSAAIFN